MPLCSDVPSGSYLIFLCGMFPSIKMVHFVTILRLRSTAHECIFPALHHHMDYTVHYCVPRLPWGNPYQSTRWLVELPLKLHLFSICKFEARIGIFIISGTNLVISVMSHLVTATYCNQNYIIIFISCVNFFAKPFFSFNPNFPFCSGAFTRPLTF